MNTHGMIRLYFFDTSAIIKLLVKEPGAPAVREILYNQHNQIYTSWVLLGETLGVLKRKLLHGELSDDLYGEAVHDLFTLIADKRLGVVDIKADGDVAKLETFDCEIHGIRRQYPEIDVADALQLAAIQNSYLKYYVGKSRPHLVTADATLANIAKGLGILVIRVNG